MLLVLFDDSGQVSDIASDSSAGESGGRVDFVGDSQNTFVGPVWLGDVGNDECPCMQTSLIFTALIILSPQCSHCAVIPQRKYAMMASKAQAHAT